ncbi:hydroxyectoine utilization dehydratase EutB [Niallia sp. NCCP-28]|uniref:hydroxyectoine utilization dehydratase EutB n=1 Tax=Niallia sp. NCCP-28 TaxID=2934712 RepID=UPI002080C3EA|nr:hydroxyectoine utilization dehydratase EutB [Niallia sp. NCCP-28]GKU83631.1 hydroxyectoine utilization dehydratase EutB [Niallia sp. NCCP-28]
MQKKISIIAKDILSLQKVWQAKNVIKGLINKTPLVYSPILSSITGKNIYLKYEHMHESGAFKMRGAANALLQLSPKEKTIGVTTFSTGNHGLAVAHIAKKLGIRAVICVSTRVPYSKLDRIKELGAELEIYGEGQDDAELRCYQLEQEQGLKVIPPFDHLDVIAGQGTIALELLEDLPSIDCVIGGLSGGGLLSGIGLVMKTTNPNIAVLGLSMEKGAVMHASLKAGNPVVLNEYNTLADSLLGGLGMNNSYTFPLIKEYIDQSALVSEETIAKGMALLYKHHHIIVEGAAAIGVGAIADRIINIPGQTIAIIISGCNVDLDSHYQAILPYISDKNNLIF